MLIFDGHLDLAMNAVLWNRDITRPLDEVRRREAGMTDKRDRGHNTTTLPEIASINARRRNTSCRLPEFFTLESPALSGRAKLVAV